MAGTISNVRIPPDSTGKRIQSIVEVMLDYDTGTQAFSIGDKVTGASSGATGNIIHVSGTVSSGYIRIVLDAYSATAFTDGEDLNVGGAPYAKANGIGTPYYTQTNVIAGGNEPHNYVSVDYEGALYVRNAEGAPLYDAFGKQSISESFTLADYMFLYDLLPDNISQSTAVGGTIAYNSDVPCATLQTTMASGSYAKMRTDLYHKYQSGISQLIEMTLWVGDAGKADVIRRWGYFDDNNGLFFELNETTLYAVIRSKATGTVQETKIIQANWNKDTLDGSGDYNNQSRYDLDVSKSNIYWIDLQWLGVGRARFGVIIDGKRIVCHENYHANNQVRTYMSTASLPISWEQINTDAPASTSEMSAMCSTVKAEGRYNPPFTMHGMNHIEATVSGNEDVHLFSFRAAQNFDSLDNRVLILPGQASFQSETSAIGIKILKGTTIVGGATWGDQIGLMEFDETSTTVSGGEVLAHRFISQEGFTIQMDKIFDFNGEKVIRRADITAEPHIYTVSAHSLNGSSSAVRATLNWKEIW